MTDREAIAAGHWAVLAGGTGNGLARSGGNVEVVAHGNVELPAQDADLCFLERTVWWRPHSR